jgi:hypothetical protein
MAVLAVNWDDAAPADINLDLVALNIASKTTNSCTITDLWTGDVSNTNGSVQNFPGVAPHAHIAKMIKCLPF